MDPDHVQLPRDTDASGRDLGDEEIALVAAAIRSGTLNATRGTFVRRLESAFAARMGAAHAVACASGTAAIHAAVSALGVRSGDEIVTSAITDMGAIMPMLYEGAAPVFCDVDPDTALITADRIAPLLTKQTRAIVVTHLFGQPCDMAAITALAQRHGVAVIEDCAQAPLAADTAGSVGGFGCMACFSFQQGKHMTTGEGGAVITRDAARAARLRKFVDKGWGYADAQPDHDFPALNGRMTELQGAVGLAQLAKLDGVLARRRAAGARMRALLRDVPGVALPPLRPGTEHSYWRFPVLIDPDVVPGGASAVARALAARGIAAQPHYVRKPAYRTAVFRDWEQHPVVAGPYRAAQRTPEPAGAMRGTARALRRLLVLPWNERYTDEHVLLLARALREAAPARPAKATNVDA